MEAQWPAFWSHKCRYIVIKDWNHWCCFDVGRCYIEGHLGSTIHVGGIFVETVHKCWNMLADLPKKVFLHRIKSKKKENIKWNKYMWTSINKSSNLLRFLNKLNSLSQGCIIGQIFFYPTIRKDKVIVASTSSIIKTNLKKK